MIKPAKNNVLVKMADPAIKTGNLLVTSMPTHYWEVLEVGPDAKTTFKGERVLINDHARSMAVGDGEFIINEDDIVAYNV